MLAWQAQGPGFKLQHHIDQAISAYHPSTQEEEAGESEIQHHWHLHSESQVSPVNMSVSPPTTPRISVLFKSIVSNKVHEEMLN